MNRFASTFFLGFFFVQMALAQSGASGIVGTWFNEEKTSKVQIYQQGDRYFGKIIWLNEPNEGGKPRVDKENPDAKLRTRPLLGLVLLSNFKYDEDNVWEDGKIYDPRNGKTYSCKITKVSDRQLDIRGYIGTPLLGRTSKFTKAE